MDYELSKHARDVMEERQIQTAWMERALVNPARIEPSNVDPRPKAALSRFPSSATECYESS